MLELSVEHLVSGTDISLFSEKADESGLPDCSVQRLTGVQQRHDLSFGLDTLKSMHDLSVLLGGRAEMKEQEQLIRAAVEGRCRVLGKEHPETLKVVTRLIQQDQMPKSVKAPAKALGGPKTSLKATEQFMAQVAAGEIKRTDLKALDKKIWRRILQEADLS